MKLIADQTGLVLEEISNYKTLEVKFANPSMKRAGYFYPERNLITINKNLRSYKETLAHEFCHFICYNLLNDLTHSRKWILLMSKLGFKRPKTELSQEALIGS